MKSFSHQKKCASALATIALVIILLAPTYFALATSDSGSTFVPLENLPGIRPGDPPSTFVNSAVSFTIAIGALLAVIMIVWGGLQYMTSNHLDKKSDARDIITSALSGLILILFSWILLNLINPDILKLEFFK